MRDAARFLVIITVLLSASTMPASANDAERGQKVFNKCKACHAVKEAKHKIGPHLIDLFGRISGSLEGFRYSSAMVEAATVWNEETLDAYLRKPRQAMKGTKMAFVGLKKKEDRDDVIAYLKTFNAANK